MNNQTPILLDRLARALADQGITLKRHQLLAVAASTYGHRNANEFSAEASKGALNPPAATPLGRDEHGLLLLRDPVADAMFAVEPMREAVRADRWSISPYGNLLTVEHLDPDVRAKAIGIHTATISHRHGVNSYAALTRAKLDLEIAGYCKEWWNEARERDQTLPEDPSSLTDEEVVRQYFAIVDDEYLDVGETELETSAATANIISSPSGEAWVIATTNLEPDEPLLWWNDKDGFGDLASASVYPDRTGRLPQAGQENVEWVKLPTTMVARGTGNRGSGGGTWRRVDDSFVAVANAIAIGMRAHIAQGLNFGIVNVETDGGDGWRTMLVSTDRHDAADATAWKESQGARIARAGGAITIEPHRTIVEFEGKGWMDKAASPEDWWLAMTDLLRGDEDGRIIASFEPQAYLNNWAMTVDAEGDTKFDVTFEILLMGAEAALTLADKDGDHLQEAIDAPAWIKNWKGPFAIHVAEAIAGSDRFH